MMMLTIVPLSLFLLAGSCLGDEFGYGENNGPATWGDHYLTCNGDRQSPINIETFAVQEKVLPPLMLIGNCELQTVFIVNNGHTVMVTPEKPGNCLLTVSGGPLGKSIYKFVQLHFHWGEDNSEGSEHTINNKSYAMELHAVFSKEGNGTLTEAFNHSNDLAVLGYWLEVLESTQYESCENEAIQRIVDILDQVGDPNGYEIKMEFFPLLDLLYPCGQYYYTYEGSLTTPPCSEVVTWIVFEQPKTVCNFQVSASRKLWSGDGLMTHNFRPVQPLGDRIVKRSKSKLQSCSEQKQKW